MNRMGGSSAGHDRFGGRGTRTTSKLAKVGPVIGLDRLTELLSNSEPHTLEGNAMTKTPTLDLAPVDFWVGCPNPRQLERAAVTALPAHDRAPAGWHDLAEPLRGQLGAVALRVLQDQPDATVDRAAALIRQAIRGAWSPNALALNATEAAYPASYYRPDEDEREAFHTLDRALDGTLGVGLLPELVRALRALGDALAGLRARRAALDATIARLEALAGAPR